VRNAGTCEAGGFGVQWRPDILAAALPTAPVAGLAAGATTVVNFPYSFPRTGIFVSFTTVDVTNAVAETNENNNLVTKVIAPSYAVVAVLAALSAWAESDVQALVTAALGWLVAGGTFFLLWFIYPRGMGYGDVRLSGVLGIALGYLGWGEILVGVYAGFLVGAIGGLALSTLRIVDRKAYPFGPFMLVGAVIGVVLGPYVAAWYA